MNVNLENLKKTHGDQAKDLFAKIAKISGAGNPGDLHDGGIDLTGLSNEKLAEINKLLEKPVEKGSAEDEEVKILAQKPRPELVETAKEYDLDGNNYTNRTELAKAIVQAKKEKEGK